VSAPSLVLGTAGHIDHGKSALVKALTGTDPDRLPEEKERGVTIELGFARLELPSGRAMGVVDVPGHEKFVRQMVAGATGIDVVLLVVAADDGVMPQTREHLAIIDLLGISRGVVALTKADLADAEWLTLVRADIERLLEGTSIAGAPIVTVSAKTGAGLDLLRAHLKESAGYRDSESGALTARRRHLDALSRAQALVQSAAEALRRHQAFELFAEDLRLAQRALGEITGEFTSEDLLGAIFGSFCIGK
jgi:small GTP-binding protein